MQQFCAQNDMHVDTHNIYDKTVNLIRFSRAGSLSTAHASFFAKVFQLSNQFEPNDLKELSWLAFTL